jgi:hypothetical protein
MSYQIGEWTNFGDISPWHGQLWIKNAFVDNTDDFAEVVEIIGPYDLESLAYNQLMIIQGSIYIPLHDEAKVESALDVIGKTPSLATWIDLALAFHAYAGVEYDFEEVVQVGANLDLKRRQELYNGSANEADIILHGNTKIENYLRKNQLA